MIHREALTSEFKTLDREEADKNFFISFSLFLFFLLIFAYTI